MHARTITVDARPELIDAGIAFVRDTVFKEVMSTPGCVGMSFVVDRDSGRCVATTAWESEWALHDSEQRVRPIRERSSEMFGGSPEVATWEVAVAHRDHQAPEGAWVRATWIEGDPADVDRNIELFTSTTLATAERFDGFCSANLLVNRDEGRSIATFAYDDQDALARTRPQADQLRARSASDMDTRIIDVREFELVIAHLHLPETA